MLRKYKDLSKNVLLFSISSFGQKILAFLLVPFYTGFLTTAQYGTIDLIATTINLLLPVFTLNISEAVMRYTLENREENSYLSFGLWTMLKGGAILGAILAGAAFVPFLRDYRTYFCWIFLIFAANSLYTLMQNYLRATGKLLLMVLAGLANSIVMLVLNILLIAGFGMGLNGYYTAMLSGLLAAVVIMAAGGKLHRRLDLTRRDFGGIKKECLRYAVPTIFTSLAWWINSSLDRYFVTAMCGVGENGIYSVAYKIPTILGVFQAIFMQAWTLSAITEFDRDDKDGFFGKTYEMYNSMMLLMTSAIMLMNIPLSRLLYANEFFSAWRYVPLLLVSSLFSAMSGYLGSIFSAVKDTKTAAYSTLASAAVNLLLNAVLIPGFGAGGAAFATAVSYAAAWSIRMAASRKYIRMKITMKKDLTAYFLLLVQTGAALTEGQYYLIQTAVLAAICLLYAGNYTGFLKRIKLVKGGEEMEKRADSAVASKAGGGKTGINRTAVVCGTPIQLIRAIQICCRTDLFEGKKDLFVAPGIPRGQEIVGRLREENIFEQVYFADVSAYKRAPVFRMIYGRGGLAADVKRHKYNRLAAFNIDSELAQALYNLNKGVEGFEYHCIEDCPGVYAIYERAQYKKHDIHRLFGIEQQCFHISTWWSSCPEYIHVPPAYTTSVKKLPAIDTSDTRLLETVNRIFGYAGDGQLDNADLLIMEESHFTDGLMIDNADYRLYEKVKDICKNKSIMVKLHPRTKINRFEKEFTVLKGSGIPWELFLWNRLHSGKKPLIQMGIVCATMVSDKLLFNDESPKVILVKLFRDKLKTVNGSCRVNETVIGQFEKISEIYDCPDRLFIPDSETQLFEKLDSILKKGVERQ